MFLRFEAELTVYFLQKPGGGGRNEVLKVFQKEFLFFDQANVGNEHFLGPTWAVIKGMSKIEKTCKNTVCLIFEAELTVYFA